MEISHYFNAIEFSAIEPDEKKLPKFSIGNKIVQAKKEQSVADFRGFEAAIVGVPFDNGSLKSGIAMAPDKIRRQLYRLPVPGNLTKLVDFGNLSPGESTKSNLLALRDIVGYLKELDIPVIILGGSQELTGGICEAFSNNKFFTLSVVDAVLDVKKGVERFNSANYLTRIFKTFPRLFQFNLLAWQRHLVHSKLFEKTAGINHHISLGKLRDDFSMVEPVLRNSDVLSFDFGAVKYADAAGSKQQNPNGLRSEEACQLAKYAGLSEKLKVFGLFEADVQKDETEVTGRLLAEIIWYFMEGLSLRSSRKPENTKTYRVEIDQLDKPIVFYEDEEKNRWWFEVESVAGERIAVACSELEYLKASENEIPELWLEYLQKMDELSK